MSNEKIRIAIVGYGNIGKGVEKAIAKTPDMELVVIFTRRDPSKVSTQSDAAVVSIDDAENWIGKVDVAIMCGGSATDLPVQVPEFAKLFNTVDSFDTHAKIPEFYREVNEVAEAAHHTSIISVGWDPGLFSKNRVEIDAIMPESYFQTFWGPGVSQGHSDAVRRVEGVKDARQYTIPIDSAVESVRNGEKPVLSAGQKHKRVCYVVVEDGADREKITSEIKSMPNYFADYDTEVHFITEEEMAANHSEMRHGGSVIGSGETGNNHKEVVEFSLNLDSNPEFTGCVLVAYARAAYRMNEDFIDGAKTVFDVPPAMLSTRTQEELLKSFL